MSPVLTFCFGLLLLVLFGWYFTSDLPSRKRWLGLVLSVLLAAFCIEQITPPDKKIRLGLDLQGGTSFLIRLIPQTERGKIKDEFIAKKQAARANIALLKEGLNILKE